MTNPILMIKLNVLSAVLWVFLMLLMNGCGQSGNMQKEVKYADYDVLKERYCYQLDAQGDEIKQGLFEAFYPSGHKQSEGHYKMGLKEGKWLAWHDNEALKQECFYQADKLHGLKTIFNIDGIKTSTETFVAGVRNGAYRKFFLNGQEEFVVILEAGTREGSFKRWNEAGKLIEKGQFVAGYPSGRWIYYSPDGRKKEEGDYIKGLKQGEWLRYQSDGSTEKINYKDGKLM